MPKIWFSSEVTFNSSFLFLRSLTFQSEFILGKVIFEDHWNKLVQDDARAIDVNESLPYVIGKFILDSCQGEYLLIGERNFVY